jgi:copper chaperone CopZ
MDQSSAVDRQNGHESVKDSVSNLARNPPGESANEAACDTNGVSAQGMTEQSTPRVVEFSISGMTCAACSTRLEKVLNRQPGMQATVNLATERARVRLSGRDEAAVLAAVGKAGFSAAVVDGQTREKEKAAKRQQAAGERRQFFIAALLTLPLVAQMPFMWLGEGHGNELPRDRKSTRLNSSHRLTSRMPSSA